jgi:uncharacterized membrane protein YeaQ/YmgE (transglycosylase-associated protein family)
MPSNDAVSRSGFARRKAMTMTLVQFLVLLLVAGVCGGLAQALTGFSRGGCLTAIALGFIGALLGTWIAGALGLPELLMVQIGGQPFPIVWSIIGAALFAGVLSLLTRPYFYRRGPQ